MAVYNISLGEVGDGYSAALATRARSVVVQQHLADTMRDVYKV